MVPDENEPHLVCRGHPMKTSGGISAPGGLVAAAMVGCAGTTAENGAGAASAPDLRAAGNNLVQNATFDDGTSLPWTTSFSAPADGKASVEKGAFCLRIENKGPNAWDAQVRHR